MKAKNSAQPGFSTLEILIAMAIAISAISSAILLIFGSRSMIVYAHNSNESLLEAQDQLNKNQIFDQLQPSDLLAVADIDEYTKQISSQNAPVALATIITDWQSALADNLCYSQNGDWQHPAMAVVNPSLGAVSDIKTRGNELFVALSLTASKTAPSFFIYSLASSTNPVLESSIDNSPSAAAGINAISVFGNYAYLASARAISSSLSFGQLQIMDISDAKNPKLISTYKIPGVGGTSGQGIGNSIFYQDGFVYLGLTKTGSGPEFNIIDVHNPAAPQLVGSLALGNSINSVSVKNNMAYLAHPTDSGSAPQEQLTAVDISNLASPARVWGYHAADNQGNGKVVMVKNKTLYLGRTVTATNNPELQLLDISGSVPALLGRQKISDSVNALTLINNFLFLLTNNQLRVFDISNPLQINELSQPLSLQGGAGTAMACFKDTLYVATASSTGYGALFVVKPGGL